MQDYIKRRVAEAKAHLRGITDVKAAISDVRSAMMREVDAIKTAHAQGKPVKASLMEACRTPYRTSDCAWCV